MDYIQTNNAIQQIAKAGKVKSELSSGQIFLKACLSGAFLGFATTLAYTVATESGYNFLGSLVFPTGFVMILLFNLELVTGSFAMLPLSHLKGMTKITHILHNFAFAFLGNLVGSLFYAGLFYISVTKMGYISESPMIEKIIQVAEGKTTSYQLLGMKGFIVILINALLCNWMVTMGAFMNFVSNSTFGKIIAMWIPVFIFFTQGFEHAVVNMFVIPMGIMLGADITISDWWLWNQIPVTLGNFLSGFLLTALMFHLITKSSQPIQVTYPITEEKQKSV